MDIARIKYLLKKAGWAELHSSEEEEELRSLLRTCDKEEIISLITEIIQSESLEPAELNKEKMVAAYLRIMPGYELAGNNEHNMHLPNEELQQPGRVVRFKRIKWAAAAVIFIIVGVVVWQNLYRTENTALYNTVHSRPADVLPGKNGAILTLANGKQIVLDSLQDSMIASQGGAEVRIKNGEILYMNVADAAAKEAMPNTIITPNGRQYSIVLSDGTKVWLNASSRLTFPAVFSGEERRVELTGEAYFEVAKNKQMPFKVKIRANEWIEVLGTHFNVNAYTDETVTKTTLLEGSVKVISGNKAELLAPCQQAQVSGGGNIRLVKNADIQGVIAWKNGLFKFDNADVKTIMQQISRWYNIEVVYEGQISKDRFSGEIDRSLTLTQLLKGLGSSLNYRIENNKLIIMP